MRRVETKPAGVPASTLRAAIHAVVRRIPHGRVATYGQVAALAGFARHARQVGYALACVSGESDLPWHRVVNARGEVSPRGAPGWEEVQKDLLEQEEVFFGAHDRIDLARYGWKPRTRGPRPPARPTSKIARARTPARSRRRS
jgi:methylated-DNA-protein-cysteine methyltransferase-like protein